VRLLLTGSSAFRIEKGRDSLAGRITTIDVNTLKLREIAALRGWGELPPLLPFNGWGPLKEREFWEELREHGKRHKEVRDKAFAAFSERGGYPVPQIHHELPLPEVADYLEKTIIHGKKETQIKSAWRIIPYLPVGYKNKFPLHQKACKKRPIWPIWRAFWPKTSRVTT
jgi:predicted AAA+ superfamily ATPase